MSEAFVVAVARAAEHALSKPCQASVRLVAALGVEGDAHRGATVQHRSRVARDPTQLNLRQIHLIHAELHDELNARGFHVGPGDLDENVTTRGIDPQRTGLMAAVLDRDEQGRLVRKPGVMAVVLGGGEVRPADRVRVTALPPVWRQLEPV